VAEPTCICFWTDPSTWFMYYGAAEPGSQMEPNPECPVHFPEPPVAPPSWPKPPPQPANPHRCRRGVECPDGCEAEPIEEQP
jgi:hypothetical protein